MALRIGSILALCAGLVVAPAWAIVDPPPLAAPLHRPSQTATVGDVTFPETALLSLSLQGLRLSLSRDAQRQTFGRTWWITGVGTAYDTIFSGVTWRRTMPDGGYLAMGLLKSGVDTVRSDDSQTLAVGSIRLSGAGGWLPDLTLQYAFANDGDSGESGFATNVGLQGRIAKLDYGIRLTRASSGFSPLGTAVTPGRVGTEISLNYRLPGLYQLTLQASSYRASDRPSPMSAQGYDAVLSGPAPAFLPGLDGLRLEAHYQGKRMTGLHRTWTFALAGGGIEVRDWRISTGLIWQSRFVPGARSVRFGWRMQGDQRVSIDDMTAALGYRFALSNAPGATADGWGMSAGVNLDADTQPGGWSLSLEYHHALDAVAWPASGDRSITLNIAFNGDVTSANAGWSLARNGYSGIPAALLRK